jgi:hypothetical protein
MMLADIIAADPIANWRRVKDNFPGCIIGHLVHSRHLCVSPGVNQSITRQDVRASLGCLENL